MPQTHITTSQSDTSPFIDSQYTIVFGCDDNYVKYASVAMTSIIHSLHQPRSAPLRERERERTAPSLNQAR